jgi:acetyltransferase-like isoleucine patch superfamily enzyme
MSEPTFRDAGVVNAQFGENVTVIRSVNHCGCEIGDGCFVGPFVEIQRRVKFGHRCRIQSHAFICELVTISDDCFISHGAMFINDLFATGGPARGRQELCKSTLIGNNVSIGTNAPIMPATICDHVTDGVGAVEAKDITEPGIYFGNPARLLRALSR